ncbi:hypothetical protein [Simkania negevensis]|uniref:K1 capsule-specific polysaccharide lyase C-terminal domain-containing protein n=1 Tax=Simkania negevensis (strain ATCC VR-1471 / DSM 27360 / Z) TaxID=331113 RepID=F8L319_SIMNZ|nr:hypothetical protein [Simkania negevensis]CCB87865.1 hypothetical protein SNE_B25060 [Simkania negevensis Z]
MSCLSPFVVDKGGGANFIKIQTAIDSARDAGGGLVYIRPATYKENLQHYDGVDLCGIVGIADTQYCSIVGTHSPPLKGAISIRNVCLRNDNSIFYSLERGESSIFLNSCFLGVNDGYVFDLPNWKLPGKLVGFDIGDAGSNNNGFVNNLGGASVLLIAATVGKGTKHMILSGEVNFFTVQTCCPITLQKSSKTNLLSGCCVEKTVFLKDESSLSMINSNFSNLNGPIIYYDTRGNSMISEVAVNSHEEPIVEGSGQGILTIGSITSASRLKIAKTINVKFGEFSTGNIFLSQPGKGLYLAEGKDAKMGTSKLSFGTCYVVTSAVTATSRIFLTPQAIGNNIGTVSISEKHVGNGFKITSSNYEDDSEIAWLIVDGC